MQKLDLNLALQIGLEAVAAGREVLLKYFGQLTKVEEKLHAGLVSEADVESEAIIFKHLRDKFPEFSLLGEEGAFKQNLKSYKKGSEKGRWILDPLDGTTNYVHGFPIFCISLALEYDNQVVLGIVNMPKLGMTYHAVQGQGAFVNARRIEVAKRANLNQALLATGFFPDDTEALKEQIEIFSKVVPKARGVRRAGAAAYDLCLVAEGVYDAYWEKNLKPWDTAAGKILVEEAGGKVMTYQGTPYTIASDSIIAASPAMYPIIQSLIQGSEPAKG